MALLLLTLFVAYPIVRLGSLWPRATSAVVAVGVPAVGLVALIIAVSYFHRRLESRNESDAERQTPTQTQTLVAGLEGRLVGASGKVDVGAIRVWFAYEMSSGVSTTVEAVTDQLGYFSFALPAESVVAARVGADVIGSTPLDLAISPGLMEPGDLVLVIDDILPSHIRYA